MKIVPQKVSMLPITNDRDSQIAKVARICYASENTDNNSGLVQRLIDNGHLSMLRHWPMYFKIPVDKIGELSISKGHDIEFGLSDDMFYVSTNAQVYIESNLKDFDEYQVDNIAAYHDPIFTKFGLIRYTFIFDTGIDISRELNRKSPNNIAEQSTRYVDFVKKLGIRFKECHWMANLSLWKRFLTKSMLWLDELFYKIARSKFGLNLKPEDARAFLFIDTATKVAYTYTVNDWLNIIANRYYGVTGKPHPDAKIAIEYVVEYLNEEGYQIDKLINK